MIAGLFATPYGPVSLLGLLCGTRVPVAAERLLAARCLHGTVTRETSNLRKDPLPHTYSSMLLSKAEGLRNLAFGANTSSARCVKCEMCTRL